MSKGKKIFLTGITAIAIILIITIAYLSVGSGVNTGIIIIENVVVSNEKIEIQGTTVSSAKAFTGYDYIIKDDALYLKLRYSIVNPMKRSGSFDIKLKDEFKDIKFIYLQDNDTEDKKLVWSK